MESYATELILLLDCRCWCIYEKFKRVAMYRIHIYFRKICKTSKVKFQFNIFPLCNKSKRNIVEVTGTCSVKCITQDIEEIEKY